MTEIHDNLPSDVSSDLRSLEDSLVESDRDIEDVDDRIRFDRARAEDKIRSQVTTSILYAFIVLLAVAVSVGVFFPERYKNVIDVVTLAMPVLTLVLGYYFGSTRN